MRAFSSSRLPDRAYLPHLTRQGRADKEKENGKETKRNGGEGFAQTENERVISRFRIESLGADEVARLEVAIALLLELH